MAGYRINRINEEMTKELAEILRTVKDPRVSETFISITHVDCTPDLKYAKIRFSTIGAEGEEDKKEVLAGLKSANGYIRRELAQRLNLRITPELTFIYDASLEYGAHINELLHSIEADLKKSAENPENPDDTENKEN